MIKLKIRNYSYAPFLEPEGKYFCPMPAPPPKEPGKTWFANLKAHERLYFHQTLSSVRQCKRFIPTKLIPKDSLDFQLQSRYDHAQETFPEKVDALLQLETCSDNVDTFRVLRNTRTFKLPAPPIIGHPLRIGGIKQKIHPHSVKLINKGHHTNKTNNGYSRQPADGNFFRY